MNYSRQRALIMNILQNTDTHPTAEWVHEEAKRTIPKIGIATVYRNLNALVEVGEVRRIVVEGSHDRFDADMSDHYHVECTCCGKLRDLKFAPGHTERGLKELVKKAFGVDDNSTELAPVLFRDTCGECRQMVDKHN